MYYFDACVTDNYIYALYLEQPESKYLDEPTSTEIHIFDWDGNPVANIKTEDYLISIAIDEERGKIYGLDFFHEKILMYDMPEL
ncbi:MAG: hypothetical protein JJT94_01490 [Bernardetiaceae bacterium]|nr:hypothetical protein [Bernardetiaceae bacterium]